MTVSTKLQESDTELAVLKEKLNQEIRMKEEYHVNYKRAQFDLDKVQERVSGDKQRLMDKID